MDDRLLSHEYNKFCSENRTRIDELWARVDLKALMAILSLSDPPVSQAKIAESLNLSKMTLSRWVRATGLSKRPPRKEWLPVLEGYLEYVDDLEIERITETAKVLQYIKELQKKEHDYSVLLVAVEIIRKHLLSHGRGYTFDAEYSGRNYNVFRFCKTDDVSGEVNRWYFQVIPAENDGENQVYLERGVFSGLTGMSLVDAGDRLSVVYFSSAFFGDAIKDTMRRMIGDRENQYRSLFLCDYEQGAVVEEMVLSSGESND